MALELTFHTNALPAWVLRPRVAEGTIMGLFEKQLGAEVDDNGPWRIQVIATPAGEVAQ